MLEAFKDLEREKGEDTFRIVEVCERVLATTSQFKEVTIRTYVTSVMCIDAPVHHANHTDDLVRVGRGLYRRVKPEDDLGSLRSTADRRTASQPASDSDRRRHQFDTGDHSAEWHWEGNVQASMVSHLAGVGWSIVAVANTATREHGVDIIARKADHRMLVEVKGYPSRYYVRGERKGQVKKTPPSLQARVWFSDLLLASITNAEDDPDAMIVLCLPDVPAYRSLHGRIAGSLGKLGLRTAWVAESGTVEWQHLPNHGG